MLPSAPSTAPITRTKEAAQSDSQGLPMIKKVLFASMMAASVGGIAVPAAAAIYVQLAPPEMRAEAAPAASAVYVQVALPERRVEAVPAPRVGYVWARGYWNWRGNHHVWAGGTWVG